MMGATRSSQAVVGAAAYKMAAPTISNSNFRITTEISCLEFKPSDKLQHAPLICQIADRRHLRRCAEGRNVSRELITSEVRMVEQVEGLYHRNEAETFLHREGLREPKIHSHDRIPHKAVARENILPGEIRRSAHARRINVGGRGSRYQTIGDDPGEPKGRDAG